MSSDDLLEVKTIGQFFSSCFLYIFLINSTDLLFDVPAIILSGFSKSKIAEPMLKNTTIAEGIAKAHPLKRLGEGKDSASLAKFLITEDSSWVTGQIIAVDGGRSKLS